MSNKTLTQILNSLAFGAYQMPNIEDKFDVVFGNMPESVTTGQLSTITQAKKAAGKTPSNNHRRIFFVPPNLRATVSESGRVVRETHQIELYFTESKHYKPEVSDVIRLDELRIEAYQILGTATSYLARTPDFIRLQEAYNVEQFVRFSDQLYRCVRISFEITAKVVFDCIDVSSATDNPEPVVQKYPTVGDIPDNVDLTQLTF